MPQQIKLRLKNTFSDPKHIQINDYSDFLNKNRITHASLARKIQIASFAVLEILYLRRPSERIKKVILLNYFRVKAS